jgi:putative transcriptional regulator
MRTVTIQTQSQMPASALDALLAGYAAGTLAAPMHALIGAHLELSPVNRGFVASLEAALAGQVDLVPPATIRSREDRLAQIFSQKPLDQAAIFAETSLGSDEPRALHHLLGKNIADLPFRMVMPGLREYRVPTDTAVKAMLYRIKPGRRMPQHTHSGSEVTLVLKGSFLDSSGTYGRGDIAIADEETDHDPVAGPGEDCLCFAIMDAPLRLTGPIGRLLDRFVRH